MLSISYLHLAQQRAADERERWRRAGFAHYHGAWHLPRLLCLLPRRLLRRVLHPVFLPRHRSASRS